MLNFRKNENCPSSYELVSLQNGEFPRKRSRQVHSHIEECEFCAAEVEFYSIFPQTADEAVDKVAEIPAPLYELAEALLRNRHRDSAALNALLNGKASLVF
jgi:anti-sigma factor RsiW